MNFAEYLPLAHRTEKMYPTMVERFVHAALGIGGEIGELFAKDLDLKEELGDLLWYMAILFNSSTLVVNMPSYRRGTLDFERECFVEDAGELIGLVKKMHIYNQSFEKLEPEIQGRLDKMVQSIYVMADCFDLDVSEIMEHNIDKLRKRYPEKYTDEAAEARADKANAV